VIDPERTDAELLAAHIAGDRDAFTELVGRHRDRLWNVALRTTRDPEEAADALQEALISAYQRAAQFRGESAVTTWLHRIVVNASLDRLRRRAARPSQPLPDDLDSLPGAAIADPADPMERLETQLAVSAALALLPDDQREAIILVDIEGWSVEEAARVLDCPTGTIKSRCSRGRAKLAKQLGYLRNPGLIDPVVGPEAPQTRGGEQHDG